MTNQELIETLRGFKTYGFPVFFTVQDNSLFVRIGSETAGIFEFQYPAGSEHQEVTDDDASDIVAAITHGMRVMSIEFDPLAGVLEDAYEALYYEKHGRQSWEGGE